MLVISEENKNFIVKFVDDFIKRIQTLEGVEKYTNSEIIFYISEIIGTKYENDDIIEYCNKLIEKTIKEIENNTLKVGGIFSEFGIFTFAINTINYKKGHMKKLSIKLNNLLLDYGNYIIRDFKTKKNSAGFYDCINGVSGVLYYLLQTNINELDSLKLNNLIEYLIYLTEEHMYKESRVTNFHIEREMLFRKEEKNFFKDGCINFGLAHGMSGVLATLLKIYDLKLYNKKIVLKAIIKIVSMYEDFEYIDDNIPFYPRQLDINNYINNTNNKDFNNVSWCYGNLSNALILYKYYESKELKDKKEKYKKYLKNIINQKSKDYFLEYPVICHGYASILMMQISLYKKTQDNYFVLNIDRNISLLIKSYSKVNRERVNKFSKLNEDMYDELTQGRREDLSLMMGIGGIFLVFLEIIGIDGLYKNIFMMD